MLVTSKRNDNNKYTFQELVQRTLASKSNLCFEFSQQENVAVGKYYNIRVFDPLGCMWYDGTSIEMAAEKAMERLLYLKSITRQNTISSNTFSKELVLAWYFDNFIQNMEHIEKEVTYDDKEPKEFVKLVKQYAKEFHKLMGLSTDVKRFVGNCSIGNMPPQVGRCSKGMPSFKQGDYVFVSKRNVDKTFIELEDFVPVTEQDGKIYYVGENKPSVDAPIQVKLYKALPNIRYILHSHCYTAYHMLGEGFTKKAIPCGAIEEVDEILETIDRVYKSREKDFYVINLLGHGSLVMAAHPNQMKNIEYVARKMPENME